MTWREDLRRVTHPDGRKLIGASFRGVPFFVESEEVSGGRRAVVHEFPLRNDPFVEDLGRKARGFRLEGYVLGDDYLPQKDALLDAVEGEGTGELILPSHGVRRAICATYSVRTTRADGGIATFALEFHETPTQAPVPTEIVDGAEQVSSKADAALDATKTEFASRYSTAGMPAFGLASAEEAFRNSLAAFSEKIAPIVKDTQELATLSGQIALLDAEASSLVRTPAGLIDAIDGTLTALVVTAANAPGDLMDALFETYLADLGSPVVATTATRAKELANQEALIGALRSVFALEAARLAPTVPYESTDAAQSARDTVASMLEEQAEAAGDTAYPAIVDLRSEVLRSVPGTSTFARVVSVSRPQPIPSLLLAYQLYGSVSRELDVVARNAVKHPGFVVGDLKVLSDG